MGADRRNYVMSVEIAMAREMAYRNKLERPRTEDTDPQHAQGQTHISCQAPWITQGASSNSCPSSTLGLMQNQRPGTAGSMPLARPPPFPHALSSPTPLWTPIHGADQNSRSNPIWSSKHLPDQKRKVPIHHDQPLQLGNFFCLLCQIDCTTPFNLMMHYQGQRHRAKLGEPKGNKVAGGSSLSTANDRLYCKMCKIWCKDIFTFKLHLQCKNHILTYREHEKKMKRPV